MHTMNIIWTIQCTTLLIKGDTLDVALLYYAHQVYCIPCTIHYAHHVKHFDYTLHHTHHKTQHPRCYVTPLCIPCTNSSLHYAHHVIHLNYTIHHTLDKKDTSFRCCVSPLFTPCIQFTMSCTLITAYMHHLCYTNHHTSSYHQDNTLHIAPQTF